MGYSQQWADDQTVAAYGWEAEVNGIITAVEFNADGTETPLATAFERVDIAPSDALPNGHTTFTAKVATKLRARPLRDTLPVVEITLDAGDELIWQHRVVKTIGLFGAQMMSFETLLIGKITPNGKTDLLQVYPNGEQHEHASVAAAMEMT